MNIKITKKILSILIIILILIANNPIFAISLTKDELPKEEIKLDNTIELNEIKNDILNNDDFITKNKNNNNLLDIKKYGIEKNKIRSSILNSSDYEIQAISDELIYNIDYPYLSSELGVQTDLENDYYISNNIISSTNASFSIIKHDIKNNTNEVIYTYNGLFSPKQYVRGNIIYIEGIDIAQFLSGDCVGIRIIGYDITQKKVTYNKFFSDAVLKDGDKFHTFVVDSKERVYIEYDFTGLIAFNSDGTLLFDKNPADLSSQSAQLEIVLHSVTPNDDGILFSIGAIWDDGDSLQTIAQGYQKLNANGTFKYSDYTIFANEENVQYVLDPNWKFIDNNGTYAVNQYGHLARFNYIEGDDQNKGMVQIEIIDSAYRNIIDSIYGYLLNSLFFIKDNYLYILGREGIIRVFDINNNYKSVGTIDTGITIEKNSINGEFLRITSVDDKIYIHYYDKTSGTLKNLYKTIDLSDFIENKNIWIRDFATQKHTQNEITNKYNASLPKYNYNNGLYEITPVWHSPYVAGKLKQGPIDDTLNRLNFQRWLYGVNDVTINYDKMERNQKGAVVLSATNELTHYPSQPADMDDNFFKDAYAACNVGQEAGDLYNGNCAQGQANPAETIDGFIDEIYNVSPGSNVGHRLNLLDLDVNRTSFGFCNRFTTLSMYYNENWDNNNNEIAYPYPTAGNYPMQLFNTSEYFSILLTEAYTINDLKIELEYNGVTYKQPDFHIERSNTIVFMLPSDLINALGGPNRNILDKFDLNIKVKNLKNKYGDITNFDYDIYFYDVNTPQEEPLLGDINEDGDINVADYTMLIRYIKGYENLTIKQKKLADVNKDGDINVADYTIIIRYIKGYETIS